MSLSSLSELARFAGGLSLFVSGDTGPLHLAAASGVPCLGLFTQTDPPATAASAPSTSIW